MRRAVNGRCSRSSSWISTASRRSTIRSATQPAIRCCPRSRSVCSFACARDDTVARLGGDEFVVLSENLASRDDAATLAEGVLERMRHDTWADSQPLQVMPSIGIALFPEDRRYRRHAAQARGRRDVRSEARRAQHVSVLRTEHERSGDAHAADPERVARCACRTSFHAAFPAEIRRQQRVARGRGSADRLHDPQLGTLAPLEFIPIAERSGQIVQIGYWVLREACRQIRRWIAQGLPPIKVAINLSPRQLLQADLVPTMLEIVKTEGVKCDQIMFEITETVAMQDAPRTIDMLREFQASGFEIAIDDFGTGYSSLAYLQRFRVKQLKIDRFFTNGLDAPAARKATRSFRRSSRLRIRWKWMWSRKASKPSRKCTC